MFGDAVSFCCCLAPCCCAEELLLALFPAVLPLSLEAAAAAGPAVEIGGGAGFGTAGGGAFNWSAYVLGAAGAVATGALAGAAAVAAVGAAWAGVDVCAGVFGDGAGSFAAMISLMGFAFWVPVVDAAVAVAVAVVVVDVCGGGGVAEDVVAVVVAAVAGIAGASAGVGAGATAAVGIGVAGGTKGSETAVVAAVLSSLTGVGVCPAVVGVCPASFSGL